MKYTCKLKVFFCGIKFCLANAIKFIIFNKRFLLRQFVQVNPERLVDASCQTVVISNHFSDFNR